ncbi:YsnF/AvaK domain-containing protein [Noviherbaspirillum aerium]|uniref:YsnF/AvaK domain-containing protein n=1 Tax=Noviherbaspirillum aerium TaxID=2588497 RepID=UPI001CEF6049|nr:YsnF/AvaK domain-containing protein [Noviherbaspirillum aerium]
MENTVVGVYDSYAQAQNAMNELLSAGFSRSDVQLSPDADGMTTSDSTASTDSSSGGIGGFFRSLFGMDEHHEHRDIYSEAVRRGSCVLSVNAASEEQRDRATEIMNRFDPVDIDERSSHWRSQGWSRYDESAPMYTDSEIEKDRAMYGQSRAPSIGQAMSDMSASDSVSASRTDWSADTTRTGAAGAAGAAGSAMSGSSMPHHDSGMGDRTLTGTQADGTRIPVIEEELQVGKREVQRGGVRVYQRVRETPVSESVQLREEHVKVERHPVDQPASMADLDAIKAGAVEMRETAEEAVVSKTARVVEEVVVGKETTQRTEDINDTVRRTDVEVEQLGTHAGARTDMMSDYRDTGMTADDSDYRTHWQTAYGQSGSRYEDYDAAYRYGSTMAGNERYKDYRWEDAEPGMRREWETNHPESAWEKVKDAVRYGAERVSGRGQR